MEKWKIVGYRIVNFKAEDGKMVDGYNLYLAREPQTTAIVGLEVCKLFVSKAYCDYVPQENQMVTITYNRYGKVASVVPCEV